MVKILLWVFPTSKGSFPATYQTKLTYLQELLLRLLKLRTGVLVNWRLLRGSPRPHFRFAVVTHFRFAHCAQPWSCRPPRHLQRPPGVCPHELLLDQVGNHYDVKLVLILKSMLKAGVISKHVKINILKATKWLLRLQIINRDFGLKVMLSAPLRRTSVGSGW